MSISWTSNLIGAFDAYSAAARQMAGLILGSSGTDACCLLLVVIDYYSRYYEVEILMSITASQITSRLEKIFAFHLLPVTITSDNGPQFRSEHFEHCLVDNGILHRKVTPQWAQGNGGVERQNRSLLKSMRIAQAEGKSGGKSFFTTLQHTAQLLTLSQEFALRCYCLVGKYAQRCLSCAKLR